MREHGNSRHREKSEAEDSWRGLGGTSWSSYVKKENDHVLVSAGYRVVQSLRVFRSAAFVESDHIFLLQTLKIRL